MPVCADACVCKSKIYSVRVRTYTCVCHTAAHCNTHCSTLQPDAGKASGEANKTAWEKEYQGQVIYVPSPPHPCVRDTH